MVAAAVLRDTYTATSAAEMRRVAMASRLPLVQRPVGGASCLANPPYPNFDLNQVVAVAKQYQGVPYRYGGDNPAGFDCSGFTQYVYAQFGVSLPHSSSRQSSGGTAITPDAALPGDLVVMDGGGHIGIYLGGNMMIDAGTPGHRRLRSARSTTRTTGSSATASEPTLERVNRLVTCRCTAVTATRATLKSSDTENLRREPCESRAASSPWMHARSSA